MSDVGKYYDQEVPNEIGMTGAGLIWLLGRDHLSPSYDNTDEIALNARNWRLSASLRVLSLANCQGISPNDYVLDIGTGIGGPGRDIALNTAAHVFGVNISLKQLKTLRRLSTVSTDEPLHPYLEMANGDVQNIPFEDNSFDHATSINMFYHVPCPELAIAEIARILKVGGTFGLDDWFITNSTLQSNLDKLRYEWSAPSTGFHNIDYIKFLLAKYYLCLVTEVDYTKEAGEFLTEERFGRTYDEQIHPQIIESFPKLYQYEGYEPEHAEIAAQQLRDAIMFMGELYRNGQAVYSQLIVQKVA